jgi:hypothetical protein
MGCAATTPPTKPSRAIEMHIEVPESTSALLRPAQARRYVGERDATIGTDLHLMDCRKISRGLPLLMGLNGWIHAI